MIRHPEFLWARRSTAAVAFPGMLITQFMVMFARTGWNHEWGWALSQAAAGTVLLAPLVAGVVAFDRARRVEPTLTLLALTAPRGRRALLGLPIAAWTWACAAWICGLVVAASRAYRGGAVGPVDPWIFIEPPALLLAAAAIGYATGSFIKGPIAGAVAALILLLGRLQVGTLNFGLEKLFAAGGSTGTLIGRERTPQSAAAIIALHLALAGFSVALAWAGSTVAKKWNLTRIIGLALTGSLVLTAGFALSSVSRRMDPFRYDQGRQICVTGAVTVCGHYQAKYLLEISQKSLTQSIEKFSASGIDWQTSYVIFDGRAISENHGVLQASVEEISGGELSSANIAETLVSPRNCRESYGSRAPVELGEQQRVVLEWVSSALSANTPSGPAPVAVRAAYTRLRSCAPMLETFGR